MKHEDISYYDGDQRLIGQLIYSDDTNEPKPAIIVFHAFEGRGEFALDYAKELAEKGFVVFAADMYGDAVVESTIPGCFKLIGPFLKDRELVRRRAMLAYETLSQQKQVQKNKIGAVGFCFGGMCVLELARSGADLTAGISMHGVLSKSKLPTHALKSKLLILHGYQDPQVPPEHLQAFAEEMAVVGMYDWTFTFFGDAMHSFTDPKTGTFDPKEEKEMGREYNAVVARRSFCYALDFFNEFLLG